MHLGVERHAVRVAFVASHMVDETIARNAVQIGRELGRWAIALAGLDNLAPDVLENILRGVSMATLPQQVAIQRIIVTSIQCFERTGITVLVSQHQRAIVGNMAHGGSIGQRCSRA